MSCRGDRAVSWMRKRDGSRVGFAVGFGWVCMSRVVNVGCGTKKRRRMRR